MNLDKLKDPFSPDEIEWRVQQSGVKNGKPWAMVLAYVTSRAVMDRLDEVFGIMGWKDSYIPGADGGVICKLSVWDNEKKEWITKEDGSENTNIDAVKGGISGALKRAAVKFGIGRYLYNIEASFAIFSDAGKHSYIIYPTRDDQKRKTNGN
ncbi:MAG: Rad52/Rad22 family DNA repair protein, partial [Spirochaetota bacterium]|nr:Rad52/Rad22 family DNA repair protein [Spirochaetota bacterium]